MWTPTDIIGPKWGNIRVVIDGRDVTWHRARVSDFARRKPTARVQKWQHTDPYGPNNATILFPRISNYDDRDVDPDLAWLTEGARVRIHHILNGEVVSKSDPPFNGWIDSIEETDSGVTVTCSGNFNGRLSMRMHQPPIRRRDAKDAGRLVDQTIGDIRWIDLYPRHGLDTGINIQAQGSRDWTKLGFIDHVLGLAVTEDGESVTILPDPNKGLNAYRMQWRQIKDVQDATVFAGAHGVKVSLRRDLVDMVSAVYGEGVAPNGERWRNAVYPNLNPRADVPPYPFGDNRTFALGTTDADTSTGDGITIMVRELWADGLLGADDNLLHTFTDDVDDAIREMQRNRGLTVTGQMSPSLWTVLFKQTEDHMSWAQAHFEPLAQDSRTRYFNRSGDGSPIGLNPDWDHDVPHVEQFVSYGEGVSKKQARRNARGTVKRNGARTGTITLTSDPAEMSRFDLRAGMTIKVRHFGSDGIKLYISSVQVDWSSAQRPVTLAVSSKAKHYIDLATIKQRRMEARQDPAKQWRHQLRRSAQTADSSGGWEGESGAGIVRAHKLKGGQWNDVKVVAAQFGVMSRLHLETSPPTPWWMMACADDVSEAVLGNVLGDPSQWVGTGDNKRTTFVEHAKWLRDDERLMIEAWGTPDQPCGYGDRPHTNDKGNVTDAPLTGKFRDNGSWDFATEDGFMHLPVWVPNDCTIKGRFYVQLSGEGA